MDESVVLLCESGAAKAKDAIAKDAKAEDAKATEARDAKETGEEEKTKVVLIVSVQTRNSSGDQATQRQKKDKRTWVSIVAVPKWGSKTTFSFSSNS